jgi:hypothetical protein
MFPFEGTPVTDWWPGAQNRHQTAELFPCKHGLVFLAHPAIDELMDEKKPLLSGAVSADVWCFEHRRGFCALFGTKVKFSVLAFVL